MIKFSDKYEPLFAILECDNEIELLSNIGLSEIEKTRLIDLSAYIKEEENELLLKDSIAKVLVLRYKGLNEQQSKELDYQLQIASVDIVILTGGRSSAKSFCKAVFSLTALVEHGWNTLYTRFTNVSISDSIKAEVDEKIELLGYDNYLNSNVSSIDYDGNRLMKQKKPQIMKFLKKLTYQ